MKEVSNRARKNCDLGDPSDLEHVCLVSLIKNIIGCAAFLMSGFNCRGFCFKSRRGKGQSLLVN